MKACFVLIAAMLVSSSAYAADAPNPDSTEAAEAKAGVAGVMLASANALARPPVTREALNLVGSHHRIPIDRARSELGFEPRAPIGEYGDNEAVLRALGLAEGKYRVAQQNVPGSGLMYDFVDFASVERRPAAGRIQDFGSTRVQLRVRDLDAAIAAFERFGGEVVSTGGEAVTLPAGNATLRAAIVRDPNHLFVVLIETPPPG